MTTHVTIPKIRSRHRSAERRLIVGALERNGWNVGATARDLDVPDSGLRAILKAHGLDELQQQHRLSVGRPRKARP